MSTIRPLVQLPASLVAVLTAFALAQPVTTIERPEFDVGFDAPPSWVAEVVNRTADAETLTITAPGEAGVVSCSRDSSAMPARSSPAWERRRSGKPERASRPGCRGSAPSVTVS